MYLENDIDKAYPTWESVVDNNEMVEFPGFCTVKSGEEFIIMAYNENAAVVVPKQMINDKNSVKRNSLEQTDYEVFVKLIAADIVTFPASIITKASAIPMSYIGQEVYKYGFKLGVVEGLLDKPEEGKDKCVIFQNVNGILVMHYGYESFKKNLGLSAEARRKK